MATKTTKYGRNLVLKINGTQIDNLLSNSFSQSRDTRETTTKDSADNEESVPTIMRRNISFTGLASEASTNGGFVTLQNAYEGGTTLSWVLDSSTGGDHKWSGSGHITKLDFDAPHDGNVGFSGEIKVTGVVTFGTV